MEEIVARRADGETFKAIADHLNDRGVRTAHAGKAWYPGTVRKVVVTYGEPG